MPTLTITTITAHALRLAAAYGKALNLIDGNGDPRSATNAEIKQQVIDHLKQVTFDQEDRAAKEAVSTDLIDPT